MRIKRSGGGRASVACAASDEQRRQKGTSATVKFKVSAPIITADTTTDMNHGQYVKSQGGGEDAEKACAGMPLNSTQGGK